MDNCMTCKYWPKKCLVYEEKGVITGCPAWVPADRLTGDIQTGDTVMVPRTGGYHSIGEVLEVYADAARVKFKIGDLLHGKPVPEKLRGGYGYKTVPIKDLLPLKEGAHEYKD